MSTLSISKAWDDARPIIARDGRLMFIIALATVVLPQTIMFLVAPEQTQLGMQPGTEIEPARIEPPGGSPVYGSALEAMHNAVRWSAAAREFAAVRN